MPDGLSTDKRGVTRTLVVRPTATDPEPADSVCPLGHSGGRTSGVRRGSVAVICPFSGTREEGEHTLDRLSRIVRADGDELVLVDNTPEGVLEGLGADLNAAKVVHAPLERSSYYARNVGAERAAAEWLLFIDSDCRPAPSILDDYFVEPITGDCGALAGAITGNPAQMGLLARHARARGVLDQERLVHKERPFGATANLLVRRAAWAAVGGFHEGIRSGGDVDFCWRIQDAGWTLRYRGEARVEHDHRERLRGLIRQYARYGAGGAWLERRHPEMPQASKHTALLLAAPALIVGHLITGSTEDAAFRALDASIVVADRVGRLLENRYTRPVRRVGANDQVALLTGDFGLTALDAIASLEQDGHRVWTEADARAPRTSANAIRGRGIAYLEDDGVLSKAVDLAWLLARHRAAVIREAGPSGRGLVRLWRTASRTRRLAERGVRVIYSPGDDQRLRGEARRLGRLVGARAELMDVRVGSSGTA